MKKTTENTRRAYFAPESETINLIASSVVMNSPGGGESEDEFDEDPE